MYESVLKRYYLIYIISIDTVYMLFICYFVAKNIIVSGYYKYITLLYEKREIKGTIQEIEGLDLML